MGPGSRSVRRSAPVGAEAGGSRGEKCNSPRSGHLWPPINDGPAGPHLIKPRKGDGADDLGRAKKGKR